MRKLVGLSLLLCTLCCAAEKGKATISRYAHRFSGRRTASGDRYNPEERTAANRSLPFGTCVELTNGVNGLSTVVKINDRGPWVKHRKFDISDAAAQDLHMRGILRVSYTTVPCS